MRIGHGYDAHKLVSNRKLILGGVTIPYHLGFEAHSDGDVLLHAICRALLGATAKGDMGLHFPSTPEFKDIDSRVLLRKVYDMIKRDYTIANIDSTILAQAPKLSPYIDEMQNHIVSDLNIEKNQVGIKAVTTEEMGFVGRKEGMEAYAVVLLSN
jgi:2-C-methyl-D-erythritol 2,4-cyclodiphosphate synthase